MSYSRLKKRPKMAWLATFIWLGVPICHGLLPLLGGIFMVSSIPNSHSSVSFSSFVAGNRCAKVWGCEESSWDRHDSVCAFLIRRMERIEATSAFPFSGSSIIESSEWARCAWKSWRCRDACSMLSTDFFRRLLERRRRFLDELSGGEEKSLLSGAGRECIVAVLLQKSSCMFGKRKRKSKSCRKESEWTDDDTHHIVMRQCVRFGIISDAWKCVRFGSDAWKSEFCSHGRGVVLFVTGPFAFLVAIVRWR